MMGPGPYCRITCGSSKLGGTVLCCTILNCTVLLCTVLYCRRIACGSSKPGGRGIVRSRYIMLLLLVCIISIQMCRLSFLCSCINCTNLIIISYPDNIYAFRRVTLLPSISTKHQFEHLLPRLSCSQLPQVPGVRWCRGGYFK